jgi:hypothetical protein
MGVQSWRSRAALLLVRSRPKSVQHGTKSPILRLAVHHLIANRTLVETVIPAMAEEAFSILRGYAVESGPERVFESLDGAGCDTAQV